jgi:2-C-methyl-D-erythritol 4-phosphate cytidylyltransferase
MNVGIILAGGASTRLSSLGKPKQFVEIGGKPLISYCLSAFENCEAVDKIVIAAPENRRGLISTGAKFLAFAAQGESRQESILNALKSVENADKAIIHDAARPLVTSQMLTECLLAMNGYDGATPFLQVTDTVYQSTDGITISGLLNRDSLFAGQTPECYDFALYKKAHENVDLSLVRGSSELAFNAGMRIHLYPGNKRNFKITTKPDLDYFSYLLERGL